MLYLQTKITQYFVKYLNFIFHYPSYNNSTKTQFTIVINLINSLVTGSQLYDFGKYLFQNVRKQFLITYDFSLCDFFSSKKNISFFPKNNCLHMKIKKSVY